MTSPISPADEGSRYNSEDYFQKRMFSRPRVEALNYLETELGEISDEFWLPKGFLSSRIKNLRDNHNDNYIGFRELVNLQKRGTSIPSEVEERLYSINTRLNELYNKVKDEQQQGEEIFLKSLHEAVDDNQSKIILACSKLNRVIKEGCSRALVDSASNYCSAGMTFSIVCLEDLHYELDQLSASSALTENDRKIIESCAELIYKILVGPENLDPSRGPFKDPREECQALEQAKWESDHYQKALADSLSLMRGLALMLIKTN